MLACPAMNHKKLAHFPSPYPCSAGVVDEEVVVAPEDDHKLLQTRTILQAYRNCEARATSRAKTRKTGRLSTLMDDNLRRVEFSKEVNLQDLEGTTGSMG